MNDPFDDLPETTLMVPLSELTQLAHLGSRMRRSQRAYFKKRKEQPHASADVEYRIARQDEAVFDSAVKQALNREQPKLPGFDD